MSKKPIDILLDSVAWELVQELQPSGEGDLPHVTHRGILHFGDCELEVFQLSDGQRVISAESLERFFKGVV